MVRILLYVSSYRMCNDTITIMIRTYVCTYTDATIGNSKHKCNFNMAYEQKRAK